MRCRPLPLSLLVVAASLAAASPAAAQQLVEPLPPDLVGPVVEEVVPEPVQPAAPAPPADDSADADVPSPQEGADPAPATEEPPAEEAAAADDAFAPPQATIPTTSQALVRGRVALLRTNGLAAVPRGAPKQVRRLVRALNEIIGKPYKWGGGHAKLVDRGYDCSGSVSYGLIRTGLLGAPLVSGGFAKAYAGGAGRYVTIYANAGHVYMEVAGLRLDTSAAGDPRGQSGVRWRPAIGKRPGFSVRHPLGL